jgi:anti-sigma regulatory factor (Ser/Thr protein kinase)
VSATSSKSSDCRGRLELELERNIHAPGLARSAVWEQLTALGIDGSFGQTVVLLVSEVVSNAVRHSTGPAGKPIALAASVTARAVRITVADGGQGFTPRPRDPDRIGAGYGLYLLDKAATSWGIEAGDGTTVWFELARS